MCAGLGRRTQDTDTRKLSRLACPCWGDRRFPLPDNTMGLVVMAFPLRFVQMQSRPRGKESREHLQEAPGGGVGLGGRADTRPVDKGALAA